MKKLKLQLEDLRIDSFQTTPVQRVKGTVLGEEQPCTCPTRCETYCTCPGCPTCGNEFTCYSCNDSCRGIESCNGTCGGGETCDDSCYNTCFPSCGDLNSCRPDCTVSNLPTRCDGFDCS